MPDQRIRHSGERNVITEPKVSIVMGAFNCADTLADAVESVRHQTYTNWELIVCDDASTDGTAQILSELAADGDRKIRLLTNSENRKLAYSLNRCLEVATGDLVARMDADDISHPDRLRRQVEFLSANPHYDLVGTAMQRFDNEGLADVVRLASTPDRFSLRRTTPFCHATVMTYRDVYDAIGCYTDLPRTERSEDLDLWFKFFSAGFCGFNLPEPLYMVRENPAAIRRRTAKSRLRGFQTTIAGYRLLNFPLLWYIRPTFTLLKLLVPYRAIDSYRRFQKLRHVGRNWTSDAPELNS